MTNFRGAAYNEGYEAFSLGKDRTESPYQGILRSDWQDGWDDARTDDSLEHAESLPIDECYPNEDQLLELAEEAAWYDDCEDFDC